MESVSEIERIPQVGMAFASTEEAWKFWVSYAGRIGFNARKSYHNKSPIDGKTTSRAYVCGKEGFRSKDKRDDQTICPRLETRTGCRVRLLLKLDRKSNKYEVVEFVSEHNHILQLPQACYLLPCQRKVTEVAAIDIELADASGIRPKEARELMGRQVGGRENIGHTITDVNNYLRDRRKETLIHGEAVSILRYFCQQAMDNPSFQHAEQVDEQNQIKNIFWADAQMVIDYAQFGEVVMFDTTHGTNKEYRPFGVFVGFNHFRETVIFGAVLLYNQSIESFEWVFNTFLKAHNNKRPVTIFTDQDAAMGTAIANVMPDTRHGLCIWHIMENAARNLMQYNDADTNYVSYFRDCVYVYEEVEEFENAFSDLKSKLGGTWLPFVYKDKEKWAYCYMKDAFSLGVRSTQLSESLNKDLKNYLKSDMDLVRFFKQFERVVADTKLDVARRSRDLYRKVTMIVAEASTTEELFVFLDGILDKAGKEVHERFVSIPNPSNPDHDTNLIPDFMGNLSQNLPRLKKRESPKNKSGKRHTSWVENLPKKKGKKACKKQSEDLLKDKRKRTSKKQLVMQPEKKLEIPDSNFSSAQEKCEEKSEGFMQHELNGFTSLLLGEPSEAWHLLI